MEEYKIEKENERFKRRDMEFAFFLAQILGIVSPKTMTRTVRIMVESHVSSSLPVIRITATEAREEAAILARLLPMRMALSASS